MKNKERWVGKAGYITAGGIGGAFVVLIGFFFLIASFTAPGFASWFSFFAAMFLFIISAVIFYAAHRAKPKKFG